MRLVDLLLVLLFEGRKALPKAGTSTISSRLSGLRRSDSAGDRSHRQLIDCIRSKDTDALIDAIDNGKKVNCIELIVFSVCVNAHKVNDFHSYQNNVRFCSRLKGLTLQNVHGKV